MGTGRLSRVNYLPYHGLTTKGLKHIVVRDPLRARMRII